MTGLQDAVQEYLKAPLANILPQPAFPTAGPSTSTSFVRLRKDSHLTSERDLSDQGSQGSRKNIWKVAPAETITPKKRWEKEEDEAGNVLF